MSDRARRLLAWLSADTSNPEISSGGRPELTWSDVAAALAKVRKPGLHASEADTLMQDYLYYKWGGHEDKEYATINGLMSEVWRISRREKWNMTHGFCRSFAHLFLGEEMNSSKCNTCGATGIVWKDMEGGGKESENCGACGGSGRHPWTVEERARCVGVEPSIWLDHYAKRYDLFEQIMRDKEERALRKIDKELRRVA